MAKENIEMIIYEKRFYDAVLKNDTCLRSCDHVRENGLPAPPGSVLLLFYFHNSFEVFRQKISKK